MSTRAQIALAWAPAVLYMAAIWIASSFALDLLQVTRLPYADKGVHFVEYAVLGFLLAHATLRTWPRHHPLRTVALAVLIGALWGWLDEIHQALVPGRTSEVLDLVADVSGAVTGAALRLVITVAAPRAVPEERRP